MAARLPIPITIEKKHPRGNSHHQDVELEEITTPQVFDEDDVSDEPVRPPQQPAVRVSHNPDDDEENLTLEEHAMIVMTILKPVAVTMLIVIAIVYGLNVTETPSSYLSFMAYQETSSDSNSIKFAGAIFNAVIFVVMIVAVTCVLVLLYKYRCLKIIYGWLISACALLLAGFGATIYFRIFQVYNLPLDWITFSLVLWNFTLVGMISIFWRAPTLFTQGYLIIISALLACFFTRLPEWTTWAILIAVAIYDLFAVLCPKGPLRVLVDLSQERDEPIPALLYNGSVVWIGTMVDQNRSRSSSNSNSDEFSDTGDDEIDLTSQPEFRTGHSGQSLLDEEGEEEEDYLNISDTQVIITESNANANGTPEAENDDRNSLLAPRTRSVPTEEDLFDKLEYDQVGDELSRAVKLGLGDFVFYSVLMGRAAMYDITTVFSCFIAIITGLFFTLVLLAVLRKALPALPISIFLGTIFYLLTNTFLVPYVLILGSDGVFV